jgi:hypothetical protein
MEEPRCYRNKKTNRCSKTDSTNPNPTPDCYFSQRVKKCKSRYKTVRNPKTGYNTISKSEVEQIMNGIVQNSSIKVSPQLCDFLWKLMNKKKISVLREKNRKRDYGLFSDSDNDKEILIKIEKHLLYKSIIYAEQQNKKMLTRSIMNDAINKEASLKHLLKNAV